jgi:hypothetical protein
MDASSLVTNSQTYHEEYFDSPKFYHFFCQDGPQDTWEEAIIANSLWTSDTENISSTLSAQN